MLPTCRHPLQPASMSARSSVRRGCQPPPGRRQTPGRSARAAAAARANSPGRCAAGRTCKRLNLPADGSEPPWHAAHARTAAGGSPAGLCTWRLAGTLTPGRRRGASAARRAAARLECTSLKRDTSASWSCSTSSLQASWRHVVAHGRGTSRRCGQQPSETSAGQAQRCCGAGSPPQQPSLSATPARLVRRWPCSANTRQVATCSLSTITLAVQAQSGRLSLGCVRRPAARAASRQGQAKTEAACLSSCLPAVAIVSEHLVMAAVLQVAKDLQEHGRLGNGGSRSREEHSGHAVGGPLECPPARCEGV